MFSKQEQEEHANKDLLFIRAERRRSDHMKVFRGSDPFRPITIMVETEEEHRALSWLMWQCVVVRAPHGLGEYESEEVKRMRSILMGLRDRLSEV